MQAVKHAGVWPPLLARGLCSSIVLVVVLVLVLDSSLMDFCISNARRRKVGRASCLPNEALQAGSLHPMGLPVCITYAEVNKRPEKIDYEDENEDEDDGKATNDSRGSGVGPRPRRESLAVAPAQELDHVAAGVEARRNAAARHHPLARHVEAGEPGQSPPHGSDDDVWGREPPLVGSRKT
jgi:hypothetical protein